jgi:filamentous hemagglutinin family protein
MNNVHRSIWSSKTGTFTAVSENVKTAGKKSMSCTSAAGSRARLALNSVSVAVMLAFGANVYALPVGGVVTAGSATINSGTGTTTINQATQNAAINWQSFNIAAGQAVQFVQPNASSVALNRVVGANPSSILGSLSANGKVFLVNPNGILFGQGASVNVGGLVASSLNITDKNFMAGNYAFTEAGAGSIVNQGTINANGGYVALLGANVSNQGVISASSGTVALAAGNAITLDMAGDGLLNVVVNQGAVNALADNGGLIRADGGVVLMTAQAAGTLLQTAVNNSGVIQAQTLDNRGGTIKLLADMQGGTVNVGGTLDASAPAGGNGGFIETSAAHVKVQSGARVTTAASGQTGTWLIDPQDFIIGAGGNIDGTTLSGQLVTNNVNITTMPGTGNGDIFVNDAITWNAGGNFTTLTLTAARDVNINQAITATNGNLSVCCGRDINLSSAAAISTTDGSVLLSAGRTANINGAMTTIRGNIAICAAENINISGALTLKNGSTIPAQSLGLPLGLTLNAGYGATGPGTGGGTVVFAPGTPPVAMTDAPATINYNPVSYAAPTDYLPNFTLVTSSLTQHMLVFASGADKTFDGSSVATLSGLKGAPAGVSLVAGPGSSANFVDAAVGTNKIVTYDGYSLTGANASKYTLALNCCGPVRARTTASITPAVVVPIPGVTPGGSVTADGTRPNGSSIRNYYPALPEQYATPPLLALTVVPSEIPTVTVVEETPPPAIVAPPASEKADKPKAVAPPKALPRPRKQDRG